MLITIETAKLAKEKLFDEACQEGFIDGKEVSIWDEGHRGDWYSNGNQSDELARPQQDQLKNWLRENHNINIIIEESGCWWKYKFSIKKKNYTMYFEGSTVHDYNLSLETALKTALNEINISCQK